MLLSHAIQLLPFFLGLQEHDKVLLKELLKMKAQLQELAATMPKRTSS